jgi:hypothetical protein
MNIIVQPVSSREFCSMKKEKSRLNKEWHLAHPMPKNPSLQQRIEWHTEHFKNCNCRHDIPEKSKEEMKKLKIKIPSS